MRHCIKFPLWYLGLVIVACPGLAMAQARAWVGEVRSKSVATQDGIDAGADQKEASTPPLKSVGNNSNRPTRATTRIRPKLNAIPKYKNTAKRGSKAQAKLETRKTTPPSDAQQQSSISNAYADRAKARWQEIQATLRPAKLIVLCEAFASEFPASSHAKNIEAVRTSALRALEIQHTAGLSGDFFEDAVGDGAYRENLRSAVRGDKEAAYRIALAYKKGTSGVVASARRMEQWLRFSAELGSGIASWDLSEIYNRSGFVADAARFEKKALDLGYRPAPRLPTRGY